MPIAFLASTLVVSARATPGQIREGSGTMPMTQRVWVMVILMLISFAVSIIIGFLTAGHSS